MMLKRLTSPAAWVVLGALVACAAAINLGLSPDSYHYLERARNVAEGRGLSTYHLLVDSTTVPDRYLPRAPLYPLAIALGVRAGLPSLWVARLLLVAFSVAGVWLLYRVALQYERPGVPLLAVILWIVMGFDLGTWRYALTEPIFVALLLGFLAALARALRTSSPAGYLAAGVLVALATLTRYIGVTLMLAAVIAILWTKLVRQRDIRAALVAGAQLGAGFLVAMAPVLGYLWVAGQMPGPRLPPSSFSLLEVFATMAWIIIRDLRIVFLVALLLAAVSHASADMRWRSRLRSVAGSENGLVSLVWTLVYLGFLFYAFATRELDPIATRLMSPTYPVLIPLLLAIALPAGVPSLASAEHERTVRGGLAVLMSLLVVSALLLGAANTRRWRSRSVARADVRE